MKILLFVGAGASAELGVPTMRPMALELLDHLTRRQAAEHVRATLEASLAAAGYDIESVIDDLERLIGAQEVLSRYAEQSIDNTIVADAREALAETEWFVQHACERVHADEAALMWGPVLLAALNHDLVIASTNYDRSVELAAETHNLALSDGFEAFGAREWTEWTGAFSASRTELLKVHGSTDWYRVADSDGVVKLKHPMPLFGGVALELLGADTPGRLGGALVLPSREKIKSQAPFVDLSARMYASVDAADVAIFLGSSFRDHDIQHLCGVAIAKGCKVLAVGPTLEHVPSGSVPTGALIVPEFASRFLISTLPHLLYSAFSDVEALADEQTRPGILQLVRCASDGAASSFDRCRAIEELWRTRTPLPPVVLEPLIESDAEAVAVDALGLVPIGWTADSMLARSEQLAAERTGSAFEVEVAVLRSVLEGL